MKDMSLDQWGVITPTNEMKKPLILSDKHAEYLVENFCPSRLEAKQIEKHLEAERLEAEEMKLAHNEYVEKNYVRVGESKW